MFFERNLQEAVEGHTPVNLEVEPKEVGLLRVGLLVGRATWGGATMLIMEVIQEGIAVMSF